MEIVMRPVSNLKNYENNARTHTGQQIDEIAESIKTFGFNDPIEIDAEGVVISGHARLAAAIKLGFSEVPTMTHQHLTKTQRKAYILAANRIAQSAGWHSGLLQEEFVALQNEDFELSLTGFTEDEISLYLNPEEVTPGLVDDDACEGFSGDIMCRPGDVWILGDHRLMCGDSTSATDVQKFTGKRAVLEARGEIFNV